MSISDAVIAFNACINARDLEGLSACMTDGHVFIDTAGHRVAGKAACVGAWRGFFAAFPDYENVFERIVERGDGAVVEGHSNCSVRSWRALRFGRRRWWKTGSRNGASGKIPQTTVQRLGFNASGYLDLT
jgi:hypothetical protein